MAAHTERMLVIGYGNPGRRDDGLGPALAAALEGLKLPGVTIDSDYQLTVEHAAAVAEHDVVVFADADCSGPEPYSFRRLDAADRSEAGLASGAAGGVSPAVGEPNASHGRQGRRPLRVGPSVGFSSHSIRPDGVLALAEELFDARPAAFLLGIRGYEFNEFGEALSARAHSNLAAAIEFLSSVLRRGSFARRLTEAGRAAAPAANRPTVAFVPSNGDLR